jgi:ribosomal protein S18 acetylase RimI-like enzyme
MNSVEIRASNKKDFPALIEINHLIWNSKTTPADIHYETMDEYAKHCPEGSQFVAIVEGKVAGYIGYNNPLPIKSHQHVLMIDMGVHPAFQRKGIGSKLLTFMEKWAKEQGIKKLSLRVLATNPGAIALYQANGFKEEGRLVDEFLLDGNYVDDLLMYKFIN